jgi:hypothetical protein
MSAMDTLGYSLRAKLAVSVALTRAMVKPQVRSAFGDIVRDGGARHNTQIMYELIEVGEHMMEKQNVSAMDSPEGIVMRVQRDVFIVSRDPPHTRSLIRARIRRVERMATRNSTLRTSCCRSSFGCERVALARAKSFAGDRVDTLCVLATDRVVREDIINAAR